MKHYDYVEWLLFKNKLLSKEQSDEMEQHLYSCNTCMEIFLSLIDEKEELKAAEIIPDDFTSVVLKGLPEIKKAKVNKKQAKKLFNYQLGYYAAVASVTVILTLGGFYTGMVNAVEKLPVSVSVNSKYTNIIADFSSRIVDSTSGFLTGIENIDFRRKNNER